MALGKGYSRAVIEANIADLLQAGQSQAVAVAAALRSARDSYRRMHPSWPLPHHLQTAKPVRSRRTAKSAKTAPRRSYAARRGNPVPPSKSVQLRDATKLYEDFTGHEGDVIAEVQKPVIPDALLCVGEIDGILYSTVRDGVLEKYIHEFAKKSRPLFCVSPDGTQIVMLGGAYDFTERGIVDRTGRTK